jgi:hypothetical protein
MMMKKIVMMLGLLFLFNLVAFSQYEKVKEQEGLEFSVRWVKQKWYKKNSPQMLTLQVKNSNEFPMMYDLQIEVFQNGVTVESSETKTYTIAEKTTLKGRLNGISFVMEKISADDIKSKNYELELELENVKPIDLLESTSRP